MSGHLIVIRQDAWKQDPNERPSAKMISSRLTKSLSSFLESEGFDASEFSTILVEDEVKSPRRSILSTRLSMFSLSNDLTVKNPIIVEPITISESNEFRENGNISTVSNV